MPARAILQTNTPIQVVIKEDEEVCPTEGYKLQMDADTTRDVIALGFESKDKNEEHPSPNKLISCEENVKALNTFAANELIEHKVASHNTTVEPLKGDNKSKDPTKNQHNSLTTPTRTLHLSSVNENDYR